jgi:hypothetical protein
VGLGMNIITLPSDTRNVELSSPSIAGASDYEALPNRLTVAGSYTLYIEAHSINEFAKCFGAVGFAFEFQGPIKFFDKTDTVG